MSQMYLSIYLPFANVGVCVCNSIFTSFIYELDSLWRTLYNYIQVWHCKRKNKINRIIACTQLPYKCDMHNKAFFYDYIAHNGLNFFFACVASL